MLVHPNRASPIADILLLPDMILLATALDTVMLDTTLSSELFISDFDVVTIKGTLNLRLDVLANDTSSSCSSCESLGILLCTTLAPPSALLKGHVGQITSTE